MYKKPVEFSMGFLLLSLSFVATQQFTRRKMKNRTLLIVSLLFLVGCAASSKKDSTYWLNKSWAILNIDHPSPSQAKSVVRYATKVTKKDRYNALAYYYKGLGHYHAKQYGLASLDFDAVIQLSPTYVLAYNGKGMVASATGDHNKALKYFTYAIELGGEKSYLYSHIADEYQAMDSLGKALEYYTLAIDVDGSEYEYTCRGILYLQLRAYELAKKDYEAAIRKNPEMANPYVGRGLANFYLGNYDAAVRDYQKAVALEPKESYSYNNLANCYFKMGDKKQACYYWKQALAHGYVYDPEWKEMYDIDNPVELLKKYCR